MFSKISIPFFVTRSFAKISINSKPTIPQTKKSYLPLKLQGPLEIFSFKESNSNLKTAGLFAGGGLLIYGFSMVEFFLNWYKPVNISKEEKGKKYMIAGATLFITLSVSIAMYFYNSRCITSLTFLKSNLSQNLIKLRTSGFLKPFEITVPIEQIKIKKDLKRFSESNICLLNIYGHKMPFYIKPKAGEFKDINLFASLFKLK